jgi:hypothetical protein
MLALTIPIAIPTLVSVLMGLLGVVMFIVAIVLVVLCNGKTAQCDCCRYSQRRGRNSTSKNSSLHMSSKAESSAKVFTSGTTDKTRHCTFCLAAGYEFQSAGR